VEEHPSLRAEVRAYITTVFAITQRALSIYQARKEARGFLDFADLEVRALGLLQHPDVARALAEEYDLLLVDECQDTSPLQLALVFRLAELVRVRTVLMGDPKQAVYGFRGSDPELMAAALALVRNLGGALPPLDTTYRARPELRTALQLKFEPTRILVEAPFQFLNEQGQQVSGIIDLLLETARGWVVVDHKSFTGASEHWTAKALSYSGQLRLYSDSLGAVGLPVHSVWIHFAVTGGLVEVHL
jgi:ATP-dependent exoDNAse (exonuclease V) beta subunit